LDLQRIGELKKNAKAGDINKAFKSAANAELKGILEYNPDPIVSSDIVGNPASSIFCPLWTKVISNPNLVAVFSWYDNEWGYSNRLVDLIIKKL